MVTKTHKTDTDEFAKKVLYGINKALRKLVETSAANNESLIVGDNKGGGQICSGKRITGAVGEYCSLR